mgnify:CR=1 FL=1|jgi:hypothetical protein|tara:strand:- start:5440 stop:6309 length:870 start_codon:yes stop_codon:yes gene_type:complete
MPTYNFKQEAEVYIVSGGTHRIHVTDISFSQTFSEESHSVNTIHSPDDLFEASVINKANVANFSFSVPAIVGSSYTILETLLLNASTFDLYIKTPADVYRLRQSVMTNGSFVIERSRPLRLEISGEASQLYNGVTGFSTSSAVLDRAFIVPKIDVSISGSALDNVVSLSLELQNDVSWTPFTTVNGAFSATTMYPSGFTISKKILAGSITQYLTNDNKSTALTFNSGVSLSVKAGNGLSDAAFRGFSFGPATCTFTNRISTGNIFTQNYDWRMTQNPTNLAAILKYETD